MKYKGKYSLVENFQGRGLRLLQEMQLGPDEIQKLGMDLYNASGSKEDSGKAGEAFVQAHLGGQNLNDLNPSFPFADIKHGDVYYSVKASSTPGATGISSAGQKLNPDDFCVEAEKHGIIPQGATKFSFRWGVFSIQINSESDRMSGSVGADSLTVLKFGPINIEMEKVDGVWTAMRAGKRTKSMRGNLGGSWDPGAKEITGIPRLEQEMGVTAQVVGEGGFDGPPDEEGNRSAAGIGKDARQFQSGRRPKSQEAGMKFR